VHVLRYVGQITDTLMHLQMFDDAEAVFVEYLPTMQRVLGPEHMMTLVVRYSGLAHNAQQSQVGSPMRRRCL
jgi:hypothetical protein